MDVSPAKIYIKDLIVELKGTYTREGRNHADIE